MERIIRPILVDYKRSRFKGISIKKLKKILGKLQNIQNYESYELDHIIPYSISLDNSLKNLQLMKKKEHKIKTIMDIKIIKTLKNMGYIEKLTNYSHEIKIPLSEIRKKFIQIKQEKDGK